MPAEKIIRRPLLDPLLLALKSRRVLIAICALIVGLLITAVPELAPLRADLLTLLTALALALIGGYSLEDAARAARERAVLPDAELRRLLRELLDSLLDETADQLDSERG